ncbi:MAG: dehydratase, partial [Clostridia bacterium]|nr:dehydratase [Clostridia bacterium]
MIAFAQEYDPIPLHTDEEYAKASPFGGLIAPGVMSFMSVWAKYL